MTRASQNIVGCGLGVFAGFAHAVAQAWNADASLSGINGYVYAPFANHQERAASPIPRLILPRRPSAVGGFIVPVWVDALQGEIRRALAHVLKKGHEASAPAFTNGDAARAVILKAPVAGVIAARLHSLPRDVSLGSVLARGVTMFRSPEVRGVAMPRLSFSDFAAAALCGKCGSGHRDCRNRRLCSAVTSKSPENAALCRAYGFNGDQLSKPSASKINASWHLRILTSRLQSARNRFA